MGSLLSIFPNKKIRKHFKKKLDHTVRKFCVSVSTVRTQHGIFTAVSALRYGGRGANGGGPSAVGHHPRGRWAHAEHVLGLVRRERRTLYPGYIEISSRLVAAVAPPKISLTRVLERAGLP